MTEQKPLPLYYFGTNLNDSGHFAYRLSENDFNGTFYRFLDTIPFHPEYLTETLKDGETIFYSVQRGKYEYTILAIAGSPRDKRPGSKSVFWVQARLSINEMKDYILSFPIVQKIINQMPFQVKW
jgi:hypothetical protein